MGVNAYAGASVDSRHIIRESQLRIEAVKKSQPANIVERLADGTVRAAEIFIETVSDSERLGQTIRDFLTPAYELMCDVSYALYPEKIKWAYEAEQPEWIAETLRQNKENYQANGSPVLDVDKGVNAGPSGLETYYNFDMTVIIDHLKAQGIRGSYHVREDGVKMYGDYIMVAANYGIHPYGSFVETSLGQGIVCDTGGFAEHSDFQLDIACDW